MKTLIFLFFTIGLSLITEPDYKDNLSINDDNIKVVFDNSLNINDLTAIKLELEQREVVIEYENMNFDIHGKLQSVAYNIQTKGNKSVETINNTTRSNNGLILGALK